VKLEPPYLEQAFQAFLQGQVPFYHVKKFVLVEADELTAEKLAKSIARAFLERLLEK
jgi:hypothetical protein